MTTDQQFAQKTAARSGYSPAFLGQLVDPPAIGDPLRDDAVLLDGTEIIPYTHFSLAFSKSRGFARWVAWNIDGGTLKRVSRQGVPFTKDPRIPADVQNGDELYNGNRLDRGHLARRADLLWGPLPEARGANTDSFFFTNITPQMDDFNQSSRDGLWGRLEDALFADVEVQDLKVSAFGGPVFHDDDRLYREVRIPREYWKVLAYVEQGRFRSHAFLLTQNLNPLEAIDFDEFRVFEISTAELELRTGLKFDEDLAAANTIAGLSDSQARGPLSSLADIRW